MNELKEKHDALLAEMPEGEVHDEASCPICSTSIEESHERGEMDTYTQEQYDALEAANASLLAELKDLKDAQVAGEVDAQVAAAKAEADEKVAAIQAELDAQTLKAENAERLLTEIVAFLEAEGAAAEAAALAESRKAERAEILKSETSFSEETIAKRIGDWAMLSDEDFDAQLEVFKELSTASKESEVTPQAETAMKTVRKDTPAKVDFIGSIVNLETKANASGVNLKSL